MGKVLFVDHNVERVATVKDLLIEQFNMEIALNCWEGLAAAMLYKPDVVLMNLTTPVMDGIESIRLIRTEKELQHLPIIGYTIPRHESMEQAAVEKGCNLIVTYPFEEARLIQIIHHLLSKTEPSDSKQIAS